MARTQTNSLRYIDGGCQPPNVSSINPAAASTVFSSNGLPIT